MNNKVASHLAKGFTLIELLIVVIIVAILAAIVIPQFGDTSKEAKESSLKANLAAMRSAIELYKLQHKGVNPGFAAATTTTCPTGGTAGTGAAGTGQAFISQMTMPTNAAGEACSIADATNFKYGPYIKIRIPVDPIKEVAAVAATAVGTTLTADTANPGGWKVNVNTGQFITNTTDTDSKGVAYSSY